MLRHITAQATNSFISNYFIIGWPHIEFFDLFVNKHQCQNSFHVIVESGYVISSVFAISFQLFI